MERAIAAGGEPESEPDAAWLTPLGEFMRRRNAELGLGVATVAQRVGISRATWYRIARGDCASPGIRVLRGLARVYRVRAAELFALAAQVDLPPAPRPAAAASTAEREAGDALWRCRYPRQVGRGAWLPVELELLNLSDRPWQRAEVRGFHEAWLTPGGAGAAAGDPRGRADSAARCRAPLPSTGPGEWARVPIRLLAPAEPGAWVFCLCLHLDASAPPIGAGALLAVEVA
ncbi:MAG: helix-turn-helix transcriptional regulator [Burkholderiaceae bacterium]